MKRFLLPVNYLLILLVLVSFIFWIEVTVDPEPVYSGECRFVRFEDSVYNPVLVCEDKEYTLRVSSKAVLAHLKGNSDAFSKCEAFERGSVACEYK